MNVYRVENADGKGPYVCFGEYHPELDNILTSGNSDIGKHPLPHEDGIGDFDFSYVFGFASVENAIDWFGVPFLTNDRILKNGMGLKKFEIDPIYVMRGRSQVAFVKENATYKGNLTRREILERASVNEKFRGIV